jgi:hypothetical protein
MAPFGSRPPGRINARSASACSLKSATTRACGQRSSLVRLRAKSSSHRPATRRGWDARKSLDRRGCTRTTTDALLPPLNRRRITTAFVLGRMCGSSHSVVDEMKQYFITALERVALIPACGKCSNLAPTTDPTFRSGSSRPRSPGAPDPGVQLGSSAGPAATAREHH